MPSRSATLMSAASARSTGRSAYFPISSRIRGTSINAAASSAIVLKYPIWPEDGRLEESSIPNSLGSAVIVDLLVMDLKNFGYG